MTSILGGLSPADVPARLLAEAPAAGPAGAPRLRRHRRSRRAARAGDAQRRDLAPGARASAPPRPLGAPRRPLRRRSTPAMLPPSHWTLLVHGVESLVPGGWELLRDVLVHPGGAHRRPDGELRRARRIGRAARRSLRRVPAAGAGPPSLAGEHRRRSQRSIRTRRSRCCKRFVPDEEWLLEPGDMLYLPPGVAHWGVAEGPCFTYSIGFLAPSHEELVAELPRLPRRGAGPDDRSRRAARRRRRARRRPDPLELGDAHGRRGRARPRAASAGTGAWSKSSSAAS